MPPVKPGSRRGIPGSHSHAAIRQGRRISGGRSFSRIRCRKLRYRTHSGGGWRFSCQRREPVISMDSSSLSKPDRTAQLVTNLQVGGAVRAVGHFRWVICAVLLFGTTKNYMDRQVIGILKNSLQHQFGWSEIDYGNLVFAFQAAYALGMLVVGSMIDWLGTRIGYALAM